MQISNAIYQPHIQQDLKNATAYINDSLDTNGSRLSATLSQQNQIQIRNADGIVVKTLQGEKVAMRMNNIDEYV
ncbi:hypothetical protein VII00023_16330 [Vibrio ichthyoenteri ATCC 700023]|uniref:Uncharacterized protein n=1 Tax=Vibrio ichthyoenteri ATCC 700023 TaxID=870968 RepID=F9S0E6_9VIBR|nr:hypothetical protein [Vibrio ichthyoenteri]EGU43416.1 hypothetical protein VII00023_16330 [Vibrio ichthyoenteri ATCC 700023]